MYFIGYFIFFFYFSNSFAAAESFGERLMREAGRMRGEVPRIDEEGIGLFNKHKVKRITETYAYMVAVDTVLRNKFRDRLPGLKVADERGAVVIRTPQQAFDAYVKSFIFSPDSYSPYVVIEGQKIKDFIGTIFQKEYQSQYCRLDAHSRGGLLAEYKGRVDAMENWIKLVQEPRPASPYEEVLECMRQVIASNFWWCHNLAYDLEHPEKWSPQRFTFCREFESIPTPVIREILRAVLQNCVENVASIWEVMLLHFNKYKSASFSLDPISRFLESKCYFNEGRLGKGTLPLLVDRDPDQISDFQHVVGAAYAMFMGQGKERFQPEFLNDVLTFFVVTDAERGMPTYDNHHVCTVARPQEGHPRIPVYSRDGIQSMRGLAPLMDIFRELDESVAKGVEEIMRGIDLAKKVKRGEYALSNMKRALDVRADVLGRMAEEASIIKESILSLERALEELSKEIVEEDEARLVAKEKEQEEAAAKAAEKEKQARLAKRKELECRLAEARKKQERIEDARRKHAEQEAEEKCRLSKEIYRRNKLLSQQRRAKRSVNKEAFLNNRDRRAGAAVPVTEERHEDALVRLNPEQKKLLEDIYKNVPVKYRKLIKLFSDLGFEIEKTKVGHKVRSTRGVFRMKSFHRPHPKSVIEDTNAFQAARELFSYVGYVPS